MKPTIKSLQKEITDLRNQMAQQNALMERVKYEADLLVDKYNKLAGKINSIRTLVTSD